MAASRVIVVTECGNCTHTVSEVQEVEMLACRRVWSHIERRACEHVVVKVPPQRWIALAKIRERAIVELVQLWLENLEERFDDARFRAPGDSRIGMGGRAPLA